MESSRRQCSIGLAAKVCLSSDSALLAEIWPPWMSPVAPKSAPGRNWLGDFLRMTSQPHFLLHGLQGGTGWPHWYPEDRRDPGNSFAQETLTYVPAHTDHWIPDLDQDLGNLIRTIPRDPSKTGLLYIHLLIQKSH